MIHKSELGVFQAAAVQGSLFWRLLTSADKAEDFAVAVVVLEGGFEAEFLLQLFASDGGIHRLDDEVIAAGVRVADLDPVTILGFDLFGDRTVAPRLAATVDFRKLRRVLRVGGTGWSFKASTSSSSCRWAGGCSQSSAKFDACLHPHG